MKFRGLDANGDWMFGQGLGSYATKNAAIALDVAARVRLRKGNCFFAPTVGIDYTNLLEKGRIPDLTAAISNAILQTPGVVKINSINVSFNPATRALSLQVNIWTIYTKSYDVNLNNLLGTAGS